MKRLGFLVSAAAALAALGALAGPLAAADLKPLSAADKVRLEELLRGFDPATYDIRIEYFDAKGKIQKTRYGSAVGLGSVRQGSTTPPAGAPSSEPRVRGLGPNQTVNGFRAEAVIGPVGSQADRLRELNALLQRYAR
jgi:hypothetical protein